MGKCDTVLTIFLYHTVKSADMVDCSRYTGRAVLLHSYDIFDAISDIRFSSPLFFLILIVIFA
jgi:hypothetical protein